MAKSPQSGQSGSVKAYLILYNSLSAAAWSLVLGRTLSTWMEQGFQSVYAEAGQLTRLVQSMALLEVLHSMFGVVRAPLFTTLMQVSSRLFLVWAVVDRFPRIAVAPFYATMLLAWSVTEVVRYSYFATVLFGLRVRILTWLRYNGFFVLYPLGILSECALIYICAGVVSRTNPVEQWLLYGVLLVYVPGSYTLYTYMMAQRRKIMRAT